MIINPAMLKTKIVGVLAAMALVFGLSLNTAGPAQAAIYGSSKICHSAHSYEYWLKWWYPSDPYGAQGLVSPGNCGPWRYPDGLRVDVDYSGASHSFKVMIGTSDTWAERPCHENSDTDRYDPPNPGSGQSWEIWIRTFDNGNCTN